MAMIQCRECGSDISSEAKLCPRCGCPSKVKKTIPKKLIVFVLIALMTILCAVIVFKILPDTWKQTFDVHYVEYLAEWDSIAPGYVYEITNKTDKTLNSVYAVVEVKSIMNRKFTYKEYVDASMYQGETVTTTIDNILIESAAKEQGIDMDNFIITEVNIVGFEWY